MSLLQRLSNSQAHDCRLQPACHTNKQLEAAVGRYEPNALEAHVGTIDPYIAWLARREGAPEREDRLRIRWVYHHPSTGATILNPKV
jgi:hypothetical protein